MLNLINDYINGFPPSPGCPPSGGGFNLADTLARIFAGIQWLVQGLAYTHRWIIDNAAKILALPVQEVLALANWLLYQIQKGIYEIWDNLRFMLVLGGYLWPEPRDLNKPVWVQAFINTAFAHLTGGIVTAAGPYPAKTDKCSPGGALEHHLDYDNVPSELESTEAMPDPLCGQSPEASTARSTAMTPSWISFMAAQHPME